MESNITENVILFDWLSFTSKTHSPEELIKALGLSHCNFTLCDKGINGYKSRLYFEHISVCYDGNDDMGVNVFMSGQGCRAFESFSSLKDPWQDLFRFIFANDLNIARLDVAYDDHSGVLDIKRVCSDVYNHYYISPFRTHEVTSSFRHDIEGLSVVIGSMKSLLLVRIYDKAAERGFTDGRHWVRVELQMRDARANAFAHAMFDEDTSIGEVFAGVLLNYLRFVEPDETDSNKSRWVTTSYWYAVIGDVSRIRLYTVPGIEYNESSCSNYVFNIAGNAVAACMDMYGPVGFAQRLRERSCSPNPKYLRIVEEHRAEVTLNKVLRLRTRFPDLVEIV